MGLQKKPSGEKNQTKAGTAKEETIKTNAVKTTKSTITATKATTESKAVKKATATKVETVKTTDKKSETATKKTVLIGKYIVRKTDNENYVFSLKASNGENITTSGAYTSKKNLENGITSIGKNAPIANIEDQTMPKYIPAANPKFEIYVDKGGSYRFRLKAKNGQIISVSQGYSNKASCRNGIDSVRKNANAPIEYLDSDKQ